MRGRNLGSENPAHSLVTDIKKGKPGWKPKELRSVAEQEDDEGITKDPLRKHQDLENIAAPDLSGDEEDEG